MAHRRKKQKIQKSSSEIQAEALNRFQSLLSQEEFVALQEALEQPLYSAIRMNPLKVTPDEAAASLSERYGWQTEPVPYCTTGWWVKSAGTPISQTIEHREGHYYIQDAASMLPVELFDFEDVPAPLILDMAASPGGKTTHLIAKTIDRGLVIANDSSRDRITALRLVLQTWGGSHTAVTRFPGEKFGMWYPETFDRILLDAPCSMQNLRSTESHPMRSITARERKQLSHRQQRLLASAIQAVKPGGQVVYATCTLSPEEDEVVLEAMLNQFPGKVEIADLSARLPLPAPALQTDGRAVFNPAVQNAARLWPHRYGTSGFFCALITKLESVGGSFEEPPSRPFEKISLFCLSQEETVNLSDFLVEHYQFDLNKVLEENGLTLWRRMEKIYAIPEAFLTHFNLLPFQAVGLLLGETGVNGYELSHEWVSRFYPLFQTGRFELPDDLVESWLRGEDILIESGDQYSVGMILIVEDTLGRFLGLGKVIRDQLKNLLPHRFAI